VRVGSRGPKSNDHRRAVVILLDLISCFLSAIRFGTIRVPLAMNNSNRVAVVVAIAVLAAVWFLRHRHVDWRPTTVHAIADAKYEPLVRTDFSDDHLWDAVCVDVRNGDPEMREPMKKWLELNHRIGQMTGVDELQALVDFVDDAKYASKGVEQLLAEEPEHVKHACLFVFDRTSSASVDHPILVIDLVGTRGRTFRAVPAQVGGIAANLSVGNMGWEAFADDVDKDGVFRGFKEAR